MQAESNQNLKIFSCLYGIQLVQLTDFMSIASVGALLIQNKQIHESTLPLAMSVYSVAAIAASFLTVAFKKISVYRQTLGLLGLLFLAQVAMYIFTNDQGFILTRLLGGFSGGLLGAFSYTQLSQISSDRGIGVWNGRIQTAQSVITMLAIPFALTVSKHYGVRFFLCIMMLSIIAVGIAYAKTFEGLPESHPKSSHSFSFKNIPVDVVSSGLLCYMSAFLFITLLPNYYLNEKDMPLSTLNWAYLVSGVASLLLSARIGRLGDLFSAKKLLIATLLIVSAWQVCFYSDLSTAILPFILPVYLLLSTARMVYQRAIILEKGKDQSVYLHLWNTIAVRIGIMFAGLILSVFSLGFNQANSFAIAVNLIAILVVGSFKTVKS